LHFILEPYKGRGIVFERTAGIQNLKLHNLAVQIISLRLVSTDSARGKGYFTLEPNRIEFNWGLSHKEGTNMLPFF